MRLAESSRKCDEHQCDEHPKKASPHARLDPKAREKTN